MRDRQRLPGQMRACPCRKRATRSRSRPGTVYFAPPDYHLLIETDRYISLSYDEPRLFSRPSIDVLFESAADVYGDELIGIILSGGNSDGALGLKAILAEGGQALVQSPATPRPPPCPKRPSRPARPRNPSPPVKWRHC